ncbi:MAG TPA: 2-C-methyl-D-erythritol 4-phosphate cytidylyltransferase, partial [Oceanithermus sp.]|nr:2-C-methyl-D-erythritol 4-phosphate cytidylyltransferase [Oceanithermus sp.]
MRVSLLVPAAGRGERLGAGRPKALVPVRGRTLLEWALSRFPPVDEVLVALPPGTEPPP